MTATSEDQTPVWRFPGADGIAVGTEAHKQAFCRMLLDTYDPYKPAVIDWPRLVRAFRPLAGHA